MKNDKVKLCVINYYSICQRLVRRLCVYIPQILRLPSDGLKLIFLLWKNTADFPKNYIKFLYEVWRQNVRDLALANSYWHGRAWMGWTTWKNLLLATNIICTNDIFNIFILSRTYLERFVLIIHLWIFVVNWIRS